MGASGLDSSLCNGRPCTVKDVREELGLSRNAAFKRLLDAAGSGNSGTVRDSCPLMRGLYP